MKTQRWMVLGAILVSPLGATGWAQSIGTGPHYYTYTKGDPDLSETLPVEEFDVIDNDGDKGRVRVETKISTATKSRRNRVELVVESKLTVIKAEDPKKFDAAEVVIEVVVTHGPDHDELLKKVEYLRARLGGSDREEIRGSFEIDEFERDARIEVHPFPKTWWGRGENQPGPIDPNAGDIHVLIIPGLAGDLSGVRRTKELLQGKRDIHGRTITAQIWDWTDSWTKTMNMQEQLRISERTRPFGLQLAQYIRTWDDRRIALPKNEQSALHIMGLSAGSMILVMACEAKEANGVLILRDEVFHSVLYLSGALSLRHPLDDVNRCIVGRKGVFNYYSEKDDILTAAFPRIFGFITLPISVSWPAVGRFGYWSGDKEYAHVQMQLPWLRNEHLGSRPDDRGNNGRHLSPGCLSEKYFTKFLLPIYTEEPLPLRSELEPGGWARDLHPSYQQDREKWKEAR